MVQELRLFKYVNGINDMPFPNNESNDEQIVITSFTYNAQRMAATPTITATVEYPRCLDNDWDNNVYAEYNGEKYYIRQIPSSSKSNTSVMYKHDITLYSENFILENIYFTDVNKNDDTNIVIRCDLREYCNILNAFFDAKVLSYRVEIDSSIPKTTETKDIILENVYVASAIQEIYNQWEIPFFLTKKPYDPTRTYIVVKDCSENISEVLEYGAENSLLSIKKNNANFRKITRISGYGSDKNIPFYYPNWSQKGIIDAMPLSTNSKLTKSMLTITDMKKFDKKMPLNGVVKYLEKSETQPIFSDTTLSKNGLKYKNETNTKHTFTIPFESTRENNSVVDIYFDVDIYEEVFPTINSQYLYYDIYEADGYEGIPVLADLLHSPVDFGGSFLMPKQVDFTDDAIQNVQTTLKNRIPCSATLESSEYVETTMNVGTVWKCRLNITRKLRICLTCQSIPKGEYNINIMSLFNVAETIKKQDKIGYYIKNYGTISQREKDYFATLNQEKNFIDIKLSNFSIVYPDSDAQEGWYLNETKKINLEDIGISVNGTPNNTWNGEGFTQESVSKIPTAQNLMPSLYRNSIGERKFYNAINYPRSAGSNDQDGESGETLNGDEYENENYKDNGEYYNFETLWTNINQNEHIQEFSEIFPSITNVTNANNDPIDEILDVWFDDNDNNEVDEEGKFIHPYFYIRIPQFSGNNGFGFNLFDHKIVGEEMQVAMTSGDCAACNFKIMVKTRVSEGNETYEDVINPIKTQDIMGKRVPISGNREEKTSGDFGSEDTTQQDSRNGSIWLVLEKDNQTFNETYPNYAKGVYPKVGDKFVLLNIDMPRSYVLEAEEKLTKEVIKYMSQNNSDKWNFDIDFSRIFLQENVDFYEKLDENCKLNVRYNGEIYNFYVNNYKYEVKANEALPKITVGLIDTITINRGITQNIVDSVIKAFNQMFEIVDDPEETIKEGYLRKNAPERMPNNMSFGKDVSIDGELNAKKIITKEITSPLYGGNENVGVGFKLEEDENGNSTLTVDNVNVRKKLKATEFVIQQIQFQGGTVIQSAAAMECNRVVKTPQGNYTCFFDTKNGSVSNQFVKGDLARCQRVGYAPKYYWREVTAVGTDYIILSNAEGKHESGSDTPSEGDIIVQIGNTSDVNRQSAIVMDTTSENAPSFIMYSGINSFSLVDKDITGIVYHQLETLENGTTKGGYPELYSYGSMYFGDRAKKDNFIQFAPNENGTFEMLLKAKTTFRGGKQDIGSILNELDKEIIGGDNILKDNNIIVPYTEPKLLSLIVPIKANVEYVFSVEKASMASTIYLLDELQDTLLTINVSTTERVQKAFTLTKEISTLYIVTDNGIDDVLLTNVAILDYSNNENLILLKNAISGGTKINGGLVLTNLIALQDKDGNVTAGINGLDTPQEGVDNDLRFWAGSDLNNSSSAPFRVYENGQVFGTNFYGFHSAYKVTENDIVDYLLDVKKIGSKVLLDFPTGLTNALTFPSGIEYVGAEIELFNPYNRPVAICGQNIISPTIATLNNAFDVVGKNEHINGYAYIYKENTARVVGGDDLYSIPRWSLKNIASCIVPDEMPNYMKWKCVCFRYSSNVYSTQNVNNNTYYIRVGQSAYVYFLPLWVLVESSNDITFSLEV